MIHRDQASDLRRLVREAAEPPGAGARPRLVLCGSGKGGVGTTTLALNLAVALAQQGRRVLLVDADPQGGVGLLCGLEDSPSWQDIVGRQLSLVEAARLGPGGIHVVAGRGHGRAPAGQNISRQRFLAELAELEPQPEIVLVDTGRGYEQLGPDLWQAADLALMVSTPEAASLMNGYALVKLLAQRQPRPAVAWLVNFVLESGAADVVRERLVRASQRFLGLPTEALGWLPHDLSVPQAAVAAMPFMLSAPRCEAAAAVRRIAGRLAEQLGLTPAPAAAHPCPLVTNRT